MSSKRIVVWSICSLIALLAAIHWTGAASAQDGGLNVIIEWPNEGETLYAGPTSLLYKVPIKGRVSSERYAPNELLVELAIFKDESQIGTLTTRPDEEGNYALYVTVNPEGPTEQFEIAFVDCGIVCHSPAEIDLQPGKLRLSVKATDPEGRQTVAERTITVDISSLATIPVYVSLDGEEDRPVSDIDVLASTRIYLWRSRFAAGRSDTTGLASVQVEALSQAPTTYVLKIGPTIVNGVLYEGVEPVEVTLGPGAKNHAHVELNVTARRGQIAGRLSSTEEFSLAGIPIWAIRLPEGSTFQTMTDTSGEFQFPDIPLDHYLIALDNKELALEGYVSSAEEIDLSQVTQASLDISLTTQRGAILNGRLLDEKDEPLPFGWVRVEGVTGWQRILPGSDGRFMISGLTAEASRVVVSAPGYYGRVMVVHPETPAGIDFALTRQEGTNEWPSGEGKVLVPADSKVREESGQFILDRGWLWGQSMGGESVTFWIDSTEVTVDEGMFAVEYLPGQLAWLYLLDGAAEINREDLGDPILIVEGQMVNLLGDRGLEGVPLDPVVIAAMEHSRHDDVPLVWQPNLRAQIRDRIAWFGVGAAQVVTFVTYFVLIFTLILVPLIGIHWWWRRKRHTGSLEL